MKARRDSWWAWVAAGLLGATGVAAGAAAAHGLKGKLDVEAMEWWLTAARYQMFHAVGMLVLATVWPASRWWRIAGVCWVLGVIIFSGTLYALALGAPSLLGAVTPVGGGLLILGWLFIAWGGWRLRSAKQVS